MQKTKEIPLVFLIGGVLYMLIEILWRGHTHWSMGVTGGICFLIIYYLSNHRRGKPLALTCLLCAAGITATELFSGLIVNILLNWQVWDYSHMFGNLAGQICVAYSCLWFFLSIPVVFFSYYLHEKFSADLFSKQA